MKNYLIYRCFFFFFFKQKTAYEMLRSLVGSEMCIRDRARSLPLPGIMDEALAEEYDGSLPRDKETPLLLYCNRGIASLTAMMMLKSMGYSHVKHVVDGMFEWWRLSLPTENSGMPLPMAQNDVEKSTVQKYRASLK
eukprot:TRINITY_DN11991_c0_g1_i4.p2 TRINITY_DN11991_c0_g1~~TRINITY_DN11991_c0_g1_i4.p2  ORF type:complete len:137 (+),score=48.85 TRINITY_DN11991_c0_g1_i4:76-486(+)